MDLTKQEFIESYLGIFPQESTLTNQENLSFDSLEPSINWTAKGAVNSPPNQGSCGSCWAFTTVAVVEGYSFLKNGKLPLLS